MVQGVSLTSASRQLLTHQRGGDIVIHQTIIERGKTGMTKAELIAVIAEEAEITKAAAAKALEAYVGTVAKELKKNGKIGLVGFGAFSVVKRKAREGRNPQTGKKIKIPAKKVVKFKVGKDLASKVK
jgi:DNA-binding protein HU-beta